MKKYRIKNEIARGGYIFGYNNSWGVQSCKEQERAKVFTKASLDKFIAKYTGCGYGFDIEDCIIEEII